MADDSPSGDEPMQPYAPPLATRARSADLVNNLMASGSDRIRTLGLILQQCHDCLDRCPGIQRCHKIESDGSGDSTV